MIRLFPILKIFLENVSSSVVNEVLYQCQYPIGGDTFLTISVTIIVT